ncbi:MAG: MerR family transcriptional regulator [Clostridia bacterium]|nr:MerR family transcriptional regulator [Clostridia bacterium]
MNVQDVEKELNITRANIRFYEREGLLAPVRKENGYRDYTNEDIARLKKIIIFRKLGFSVADIREILDGTLSLQDAVKTNIGNLEKNIDDLSDEIDLCNEIIDKNIDLQDFSEDYFWNLISKKENERKSFKEVLNSYLNKHYKTNIALLFIVCIAPFLNILFDYFLLNKAPEIKSIVLAIVCFLARQLFRLLLSLRCDCDTHFTPFFYICGEKVCVFKGNPFIKKAFSQLRRIAF